MKYIRLIISLFVTMALCVQAVPAFAASTTPDIVIAQVQPGTSTAASQEYVSIYSNTAYDVDVTGWCVRYNGSNTKPGCMISPDPQTKLLLKAKSYTTFASNEFIAAHAGFVPQARAGFSGGMSDTAGTLTLVDAVGQTHDQFSWSAKVGTGKIFQRQSSSPDTFKDTDSDAADFVQTALQIPTALGLYEQAVVQDMCPNIDGLQEFVPAGYLQDASGDCVWDVCQNLAGLQEVLPEGYSLSGADCTPIPPENAQLDITELLPNVSGTDTGHEYVEIYNPNERVIKLNEYRIQYGPDFAKSYNVPSTTIEPHAYRTFSDTELGLVLPNTSLQIRLVAPNGDVVSNVPAYSNPPDDEAWAIIQDQWQFTDVPTPGATNVPSVVVADPEISVADEALCPAGKYRNPETNRCRSITLTSASPSACAADEYRNPSTNRCRKTSSLASAEHAACKPGQERNPETNRCRAAALVSSSSQPCSAGQERNPETNRCRSISTTSKSQAEIQQSPKASHTRTVLVAIGISAALSYGLYEYRYDAVNLYLRMRAKYQKPKL